MKFKKIIFLFLILFVSEIFHFPLSFSQTANFFPRDEDSSSEDASLPNEKKAKEKQPVLKSNPKKVIPKKNAVSDSSLNKNSPAVASFDGKRVYEMNGNNQIAITDYSESKSGKKFSMTLDRTPVAIAPDPILPIAYVITVPKGSERHGALYKIGPQNGQYQLLGDPILLGKNPSAIAVSSNGKKVYVTHTDDFQNENPYTAKGSLFIFGAEQNPPQLTLKSALGIQQNPVGIALSPNDRTVYLVEREDKDNPTGILAAVETDSLKVVSHVAVGEDPEAVSISPDGNFVYVAHSGKKQMAVVDVSSYPIQKVMDVSMKDSPIVFGTFHDVPSSLMQ